MPLRQQQDNAASARNAGLRYVEDGTRGLKRRVGSDGFDVLAPNGRPIRDLRTLRRVRALAIPPAWQDVWICLDPRGHIQATGRDARGRKQYRYHARWSAFREDTKFARLTQFCRSLPRIRDRVEADLAGPGLSHDKVLATVVRLLELTLIRVGNDEYARANKSFGLTTLRNRHVRADGSHLTFEFVGKSGVRHRTGVRDRRLARIIKQLHDLPGQRLFQYVDEGGERRQLGSADVNAYLKEASGENFTAKDFRTWAGTLAAAKALSLQPIPTTDREIRSATQLCVKATAGLLGNTPAVCRAAYIHPAVLRAYAEGTLPRALATANGEALEAALLSFLASN
jgi:DNA topoisomerase I